MTRQSCPPVLVLLVSAWMVSSSYWMESTWTVTAFSLHPAILISSSSSSSVHPRIRHRRRHIPLYSGDGIATNYRWHEEAFEIEVTVQVPKDTRAKDIHFKATSDSIDLRLLQKRQNSHETSNNIVDHHDDSSICLLDPTRPLRGKIVLDGTFWVISDPEPSPLTDTVKEETQEEAGPTFREVTVTIEKQIRTPQDDFDVVEYDWNGVYKDDEEEVSYRKYDEPEELNIREYAASLGVDIDNLNMSLVDKSMFSSGLNVTKSSFDSLQKAGLMKEVTRQEDGSEWITNNDGEQVPFSSYGQAVSKDEAQSAATAVGTTTSSNQKPTQPSIPFLDTDSPWHKTSSTKRDPKEEGSSTIPTVNKSHDSAESVSSNESASSTSTAVIQDEKEDAMDPISTLTVSRLKEILKERGLKVSGNKKELQDRLRAEVRSMMRTKNHNGGSDEEVESN